jgi:hypothetical protein
VAMVSILKFNISPRPPALSLGEFESEQVYEYHEKADYNVLPCQFNNRYVASLAYLRWDDNAFSLVAFLYAKNL